MSVVPGSVRLDPPTNLITLAHFSVSSAMNLPKSTDEPASAMPPSSARRAFNLESTRPALISLLSLSTISAGVGFGTPTHQHLLGVQPPVHFPHDVEAGRAPAPVR